MDRRQLRNFISALENLLSAVLYGLDLDDDVAIAHADVHDVSPQFVTWDDHADGRNVVARDRIGA